MTTPRNQSVDRAFAVLAQLAASGPGSSLPRLAQGAGLSVATTHRLLSTLEDLGVIVRAEASGYRIGMRLYELTHGTTPNVLLRDVARPVLRAIVQQTGLTAHVGILDEDLMVTYVWKETSGRGQQVHTQPGSQLEAYCSGLGKILLAGLSDADLHAYLSDSPFIRLTPNTLVEPAAIAQELARVRSRGYAVDDGEMFDDLRCVAVPIVAAGGKVVAALSVSGDCADVTDERVPILAASLREHTRNIQRKLYPQPASGRRRPVSINTGKAEPQCAG